jgi:hypothetical protein
VFKEKTMQDYPWEDNLLERKVEGDLKDLLKTLVAFANSVRPGHIATILIGEKDDGTVAGVTNPDSIQKKVREESEKIYPGILWRLAVYEKEGKYCIRVEIQYSGETPHFGGPAWVRKGSETIKANDEVFQRLIELRSEKARELTKWVGKEITIQGEGKVRSDPNSKIGIVALSSERWTRPLIARLVSVNGFWATFEKDGERASEPLAKVTLSFDHDKEQLKLIIAH